MNGEKVWEFLSITIFARPHIDSYDNKYGFTLIKRWNNDVIAFGVLRLPIGYYATTLQFLEIEFDDIKSITLLGICIGFQEDWYLWFSVDWPYLHFYFDGESWNWA